MSNPSITPSTTPTDNVLVRFHWDCGRMGDVHGMFITTRAALAEGYGKQVNFGEILGKHSEVYGDLTESAIEVVTDDQEFLAKMIEYVGYHVSGYNPFSYMNED